MSYVYPDSNTYLQPTESMTSTSSSSCTVWIVLFILFLLVGIGLGIWLLVLYLGGHVGKGSSSRTVSISGASITASDRTVTGTWGALNNSSDKVTLYVSNKPFVFNDNGEVLNINGVVLQDSQVGPNGKITITVQPNTSYNAMMIVTGDNTVHYRVFGPKKVFTQVQSDLTGSRFNIQSLNSCNGAVSETGTYTTTPTLFGQYSLGSVSNANADSKSLLVYFEESSDSETKQVLCRIPTATQPTNVSFGCWSNIDSNAKPIIYAKSTDVNTCDTTSDTIALESCQWSYNLDPSGMAGANQWCLSSNGSTTINSSVKEPLCLAVNGKALSVVSGQTNTDTWFNPITHQAS